LGHVKRGGDVVYPHRVALSVAWSRFLQFRLQLCIHDGAFL
jgi:hypothetical protein